MQEKLIDHLFRHHYGKMVSILTRIFGLSHLETIEDAVQDTFIKATLTWRNQLPENPEAWLTKAAKNRTLDIFRQLKAQENRENLVSSSSQAMSISDLFLDSEIEDSQLRMIFTACHPKLKEADQLVFALKTISGFNSTEIASALLTKEEAIKKRLIRARKTIKQEQILFKIPEGKALKKRLSSVLNVIYLIFNEGFHSGTQKILIRKDLCGEAIRLCQLLLKNQTIRNSTCYALFALMCFHASRLESKTTVENEIIDLKNQDRSLWYEPLIDLGKSAMYKAFESDEFSKFHFEAAIAQEHIKAVEFEKTNWERILYFYNQLQVFNDSEMNKLNIALVYLQLKDATKALETLQQIHAENLNQRAYLLYGAWAEYYFFIGKTEKALKYLDKAINSVKNEAEKNYLLRKKNFILRSN